MAITPAARAPSSWANPGDIVMRDSRSFTGVQCTQNVFAVAGDESYVLFKKSASELFYFVPNNLDEQKVLKLRFLDALYFGDSIFDLVFYENQLVILIQSQHDDSISLALCTVTNDYVVATEVLPGSIKKGRFNKLINDEFGPVFITYSVSFYETDPSKRQVQLVHIVESLRNKRLQVLKIQVPRQTKKAGEVWCDPFISRNMVYFFNQFDYTTMTIEAKSGKVDVKKQKLRPKNMQNPIMPSLSFVHRHTVVFTDHVFVYFSQMVPPPDPRSAENVQHAWKLHLNPLMWEPIDLRLSHHCPVSKVALRVPKQFDATHGYLHGACEVPGCREEFHLYEIAFERPSFHLGDESDVPGEDEVPIDVPNVTVTPKRTSTFLNVMNSAKEVFTKHRNNGNGTASPTGSRAAKLRQRVRRRSASSSAVSTTDSASNRDSLHSMQSCLTTSTTSSNGDISNLRDSDKIQHQRSPAMMNWSRQVSFEPVGTQNRQVLVEQLAHAKDMGFSEHDILGALEMHNKNNDAKRYAPFDSTSAMVDALTMVQKIHAAPPAKDRPQSMYITRDGSQDENKSPPPPTILENNNCLSPESPPKYNGITSTISPRSASVTRSVSFTNAPIRRPRSSYFLNPLGNSSSMLHLNYKAAANNNSSLNRLIETFNSDRKGLIEEFTKAINETKENHIHEQHAMQQRLNAAIKENAEMKVQMREFNMLETRCIDMESRYVEVEAQCREKEAVIANLQEDMANFAQLIDQSNDHQRQLKAKLDEVDKLHREIADLKSKLAQSGDTNRVVKELEAELTQLKTENREYREKQTVLACTTCMDEPRNVLYLPCLHFICCSTCAGPSDHCSICRNRIMGKIEVYQ